MDGQDRTIPRTEWNQRVIEVIDKVLLLTEGTDGSVATTKDSAALTDAKAALTNFLKEIYNRVSDASQYSNPRTRIDTRFRRLVREYMSVSGETLFGKSPASTAI